MPGWHEATQELQRQGKVQMVGIIQEQHPDRARLFMQWKQMDWPILVDSLNLLEVPYVPITLAIDEHGIIRQVGMRPSAAQNIEQSFINQTYERPEDQKPPPARRPDLNGLRAMAGEGNAEGLRAYANALVTWGQERQLAEAIEAYERALQAEPGDGLTHFRLGVAYRKRYDSNLRQPTDFQKAVEHWAAALDTDPNQYIWRRRIQQYGPRLDKPYSFYDWVHTARKEIQTRGEEPAPLTVEPGGAEFAYPERSFTTVTKNAKEPDPQGRILRDAGQFISVEPVVVPATRGEGRAARVHLIFRPNLKNKSHWNNSVDNLEVWLNPPPDWAVDSRRLTYPNPSEEVSQETRKVEFEVRSEGASRSSTIPAYALYYVCEDVNGVCMYRRQDIAVNVAIK